MIVINGMKILKEIATIEKEIKKLESLIDNSSLSIDKASILTAIIKEKLM
jgi:hypothetical protein